MSLRLGPCRLAEATLRVSLHRQTRKAPSRYTKRHEKLAARFLPVSDSAANTLMLCADARPRTPVMTAIADAIQRGEPSQGPEACASVCAASPRYALRLAVIPGHERASSRHTKRHEIISSPIPANFPHSGKDADWLMSSYCTLRSVREISCQPLGHPFRAKRALGREGAGLSTLKPS